ncbi:cardiolipin synthase A [Labrys miyagiensis]|uniref:Cardiolipin synthase n=1 Tax=Labrys miyagiensis TaxID=346912 RepID=A0ABQ6CPF6_9HYPH|nr:cardiolipin synthase [Labrys miyagiensis]GLS22228.1 cardiolipin synthase A [Labrys miyagiensis]
MIAFLLLVLHLMATCLVVLRIMLRDDISPTTRVAWVLLLLLLPITGLLVYFFFGEVRLSKRFLERVHHLEKMIGQPEDFPGVQEPGTAFAYATSINGFPALPGNRAELLSGGEEARQRLISDIEGARDHVYILYYIWLSDHTGVSTAQAVIRAARRGVRCRIMADALGSRAFIRSEHWQAMRDAGVELVAALPLPTPLTLLTANRLDLRNHRKITIVDAQTCYCGSQNCADAAFLPKARFAPWVDIMLRLEGPVVGQMQALFAQGWFTERHGALTDFPEFEGDLEGGFYAQVVGTGPTVEHGTTAQLFSKLISQARQELIISTPYFVPDETVASALCGAAASGIAVTLVLPRRNDSRFVALASRSHYKRLLAAGAKIYEFEGGLLHAKTLTIDGQVTFLGSSNMDVRSFDLNFENDVLLRDPVITGQVRQRQMAYIAESVPIDEASVRAWSGARRIVQNACATISPIL